ncbi:MAG: sulfatase [Planctomycetes bacterium]|nr:sulfatase [Planctomycetota bacterium]
MSSPIPILLRMATAGTVGGTVIGGCFAAAHVFSRDHVREFQAGAPSPITERLFGFAMWTAVEGLGFGAIALALGVLALVLAKLQRTSPERSYAKNAASVWIVCGGAFAAWVTLGTWFTYEALLFLPPGQLVLLNLGGYAAALIGLLVWDCITTRLPWSPRSEPAAVSAALMATTGFALWFAFRIIMGVSGGWRQPMRAGGALAVLIASAPAASLIARLIAPSVGAIGSRLAAGALLPRPLLYGLLGLLAGCTLWTMPQFSLTSLPAGVDYKSQAPHGTPQGPNVIVITIDTLRADALGCYGYGRPTSPFLDSLAANGVRFDDPVASAAWTKPATGTILTGLHPSRHGALYHGSRLMLPKGCRTMAEAFRDSGYVTAGFVSNPNIKKVFDFDRGFDEYFDSPVEDTISHASMRNSWFGRVLTEITRHQFNWKYENDCREINRHALAWIEKNRSSKFFLYLHYIDPHEPYSPPADYEAQFRQDHGFITFNKRKQLIARDLYDGEIRYNDDEIRRLHGELARMGLAENTLIVVTADHGEEFFEHGALGHGFSLYQEVVRVPWIMSGPGVPKGVVVKSPARIVDLAATTLDVAKTGIRALGDGQSIAAAFADPQWKRPAPIFLENEFGENDEDTRSFVFSGVRDGEWKFILTTQNAHRPPQDPRYGPVELYNLKADPLERTNLAKEEAQKTRGSGYFERLQEHAKFLDEPGFRKIKPDALDPTTAAQMKAVGYLGGK